MVGSYSAVLRTDGDGEGNHRVLQTNPKDILAFGTSSLFSLLFSSVMCKILLPAIPCPTPFLSGWDGQELEQNTMRDFVPCISDRFLQNYSWAVLFVITVCTMQWCEEVNPRNPAVKPPQCLGILLESNLSFWEQTWARRIALSLFEKAKRNGHLKG